MKRILLTAALTLGISASAALADGKVFIPLPDMSGFAQDPERADAMLGNLYLSLVLSQNCPGAGLTAEEHSLFTDSFDLLASGELKMDSDKQIELYEKPAFAALDDPSACDDEAELKAHMIENLLEAGGSLEPLPDQEKAYLEWRALMDSIRP